MHRRSDLLCVRERSAVKYANPADVDGVTAPRSLNDDIATVQMPMIVGFGEGGGWAPAGADDGSEPQ